LCGVFLVENLSVVIQVSFKNKKRFGEGKEFPDGTIASSLSKKGYHE
jgi:hypothetical protein